MLFRFWLITSLIVASVAYSGVFRIQPLPSADLRPAFAYRVPSLAVLDDSTERGR